MIRGVKDMLKELIEEMNDEMSKCSCSYCNGSGIIYSPEWKDWQDALTKTGLSACMMDEKYLQWLKDNPMPNEPEEICCWECDGTGIRLSQSKLLHEFITNLLYFFKGKWPKRKV
jgi:predicted methyltransferase